MTSLLCYIPRVLFFENVRATVGCVSCGLNLKGVMSAAVEHERSLLTAEQLRTDILTGFPVRGKPYLAPPGGNSWVGEKARQRPARLAEKLLQIREALGLSQNGMIRLLGVELTQNRISDYELGKGEPPLPLLLLYARAAGVCLERLVDDDLDLPKKLPGKTQHRP